MPLYLKTGKPVGPREVMRGAKLLCPSTAHKQLEKLENLCLIEKTDGTLCCKGEKQY